MIKNILQHTSYESNFSADQQVSRKTLFIKILFCTARKRNCEIRKYLRTLIIFFCSPPETLLIICASIWIVSIKKSIVSDKTDTLKEENLKQYVTVKR